MKDGRRLIAAETIAILERGWYDHHEVGRVRIAEDLARSVAGTRLWTPAESLAALGEFTTSASAAIGRAASRIEVTNEASLAAARAPRGRGGLLRAPQLPSATD